MKYLIQLVTLVCCLFSQVAFASSEALSVSDNQKQVNPYSTVQIYKDVTGKLTLEDIRSPAYQERFQHEARKGENFNFGFTDATYWLKLNIRRDSKAPKNWVLEVPYLNLNEVTLYAPRAKEINLGTEFSSTDKPIFYPLYAFPIEINTEPENFYLKIRSDYSLTTPLALWQQSAFSKEFATQTFLQSLYFGGLISLALYNFLLFISLKDRSYLLYTLFAISMGLGMFAGNGYGRLYFWPMSPEWDTVAQSTFFGATGALALMFACSFLRTHLLTPKLHNLLMLLTGAYWVATIALPLSLWTGWSPVPFFQAVMLITVPATLLTIYAGIRVYALGHRSALYLLGAWGCVWAGATIAVLRAYELLPSNAFTLFSLQISSCVEMLLLSFALAHRIHTERNQRLAAQLELLDAREALLTLTQESERRLESTVLSRTQKLQKSILDEQNLRQQYVRFGAMISHEFRNPLNIISTQSDLMVRERKADIDNTEVRVQSIQAACSRLVRLFEQWLKGDRLQQPLTQPVMSPFSLQSLIHASLTEAQGYYASRCIITPKSCPDITVYGDRALIEIAVFNLIDNAVKYSPAEKPIEIECFLNQNRCGISITDGGTGILLQNPDQVFEPHYRASEHSAIYGTGLGLTFVRTVCEMHDTEATVENIQGKGCRFTIWLPTTQVTKTDS